MVPTVVLPGILFTLLALYPFLEAKLTGDRGYHNILDRPRDKPVRTALGTMSITFYLVLLLAGGNDIIASIFHLSINEITYTLRAALFILPPIAYVVTKRFCLSLQRADDDLLHHGIESGTIRRLPSGEFVEETVGVPHVYTTLLATSEERRQAIEHQHHEPVTAVRAGGPGKGFFRARGGVIEQSAEEPPQLETTTD
jgi:ubiquinol-cytochrome c reductase cytochrome b subunit